ncbi:leucine-rich repeat receptor-like serine/threonine-protein kinase At2g14510 [Arabidopsis lyrata subsp. lyrata]|uniref:leucine-rich repeat receptor-like serine/threonine-protein kinase At2g14510 n=1 Tax=Arabidopsis lyrata subsp. lyrata TaxID=81972 RepID=UPI000A29E177|nr:leucine-rich repeat receptor-like serine/threonine-protein kinase At2g14510 [Arabidopsis lyrata subsp. lyrata]|eukprot:XP_020886019.1 leucine-rich repeat receptor-like serine/threonine-protein kinase At2g14510 [Arabidopsis lyrata subsp. lyrata]
MENLNKLLLLACATFSVMSLVKSQNQEGFISLDCGLPSNESPYIEPLTNLTYISDVNFIRGGKTGNIENNPDTEFIPKPHKVLRYFPDGVRNCYNLSVKQGTKYLIRTFFFYGNYDGLNTSPRFDLFLGPNIWTSIDVLIPGVREGAVEEIIHVTRSNILDICLVKTGTSTPMISAIELRPMRYDTYTARTGSLKIIERTYFANSDKLIRYPEDVYDRVWFPNLEPEWTQINTTRNVSGFSYGYNPPQDVIKTAAIPTNVSEPLTYTWNLKSSDDESYAYLYFAEIQQLKANETREFKIVANGVDYISYMPWKFEAETLYNPAPLKCQGGLCRVQLSKTPKSTLPPLMNAIEIFSVIQFPQSETDTDDVIAIKDIQSTYQLSRISWQGDPCVPKQFSWIGVSCNVIDISTPPRIITLDLSSSGLTGIISPSIQNLTLLRELDLSNNNLTGEVPEFLATIKSLLVIHLSGNNLRGSVPQALQDRVKNDGLKLFVDPNIKQRRPHQPRSWLLATVASISCVAVIIIVLVLIFIFRRRKSSTRKVIRPSLEMKNRRFKYSEVKEMTNNFQVVLGKGGFGVVYHGFLNNEQVAVKVLSQSSTQGYKEFKTEVELLLRVHHVNLVSLVGYCDEGNDLALIYEFMDNGNLKEHLSGKRGGSVLNWSSRLKIAIESALGIEYLHIGCKPPMVHRDVKSTNILLGLRFEAKLADFGLSRSFLVGSQTHVSTNVAGTLGYLDPEYYQKNWLTEKSDVYSFGIVLLEIITGQPVIEQSRDKSYIVEWAKSMLANGDIQSIMDPNLHQDYDTSSSWKALELAMLCINPSSTQRPNMTRVAHELNECLEIYNLSKGRSQDENSSKSTGHSVTFISDIPSAR